MEQMPSNIPVMESKPGPAGWLAVWIKAVSQPNEQTFVDITESPEMSARTAYIWVFIAGTLSGIIQAFATTIRIVTGVGPMFQRFPGLSQYFPRAAAGSGGGAGLSLIGGLCASPFAGLLSVLLFALFIAIIQWIAKLFGGSGTYDKLLYAFAAITVPFTIVSSVLVLLSAIPYVGICFSVLSIGLGIYSLVLQVMAVKGVNRFGWGPAAGSVFIPGCVLFILCACVVAVGVAVLAPILQKSFQQLN